MQHRPTGPPHGESFVSAFRDILRAPWRLADHWRTRKVLLTAQANHRPGKESAGARKLTLGAIVMSGDDLQPALGGATCQSHLLNCRVRHTSDKPPTEAVAAWQASGTLV
jgi:hypothetical protein